MLSFIYFPLKLTGFVVYIGLCKSYKYLYHNFTDVDLTIFPQRFKRFWNEFDARTNLKNHCISACFYTEEKYEYGSKEKEGGTKDVSVKMSNLYLFNYSLSLLHKRISVHTKNRAKPAIYFKSILQNLTSGEENHIICFASQ